VTQSYTLCAPSDELDAIFQEVSRDLDDLGELIHCVGGGRSWREFLRVAVVMEPEGAEDWPLARDHI
jgi:hypothetical protein